jgi:pSer/pThr/pTyr-binding forkhead associated (FHA) protein
MTQDPTAALPDALLDALEMEEEFDARARGDDAARPSYFLRELPVPEVPRARLRPEAFGRASLSRRSAAVDEAPQVDTATVPCPACHAENHPDARFCHACGAPMVATASSPAVLSQRESSVGVISSAQRAPAALRVTLISINEDGTDGARIDVRYNDSVIGRAGDVRYPTDAFLSPKHARITIEQGQVFIEDLYSLNGTYVKLQAEKRLTPGDTFLMGRQVLRFEKFEAQIVPKARANDGTRYMGSPPPTGHFKLVQIGIGGVIQNVYCLNEAGALVGREKGDIIFPRDKFMSGRHAQIFPRDDGHYYLADMNSSNGTWVKLWERRRLQAGDFVFLGQQLFRLEIGAG